LHRRHVGDLGDDAVEGGDADLGAVVVELEDQLVKDGAGPVDRGLERDVGIGV
jgi:hypothetical protein